MTVEKTYPRKFGDPLRNPSRKLAFAGHSAITGNKNLSPYTGEDHPQYRAQLDAEIRRPCDTKKTLEYKSALGNVRREINPVQWTDHELGPGSGWVNLDTNKFESTLGPDYLTALDEIIEEKMLDHHDEHSDSEQHLTEFLAVHEKWRANYWQQLQKAETFLTQYRRNHDMRPFNWALEERASVRSILGLDSGEAKHPRTIEKRQQIAIWRYQAQQKKGDTLEDALKDQNLDMLRRIIKPRPEYSGENDPLQVSQVLRKIHPVEPSPAAIAALEQFDTTGKIILPDPPAPSGIHLKKCTWDPANKSSIPCGCDIELDTQSTAPIIANKNRFKTMVDDSLRDESLFGYCDDILDRQKIYQAVEDNPTATPQEKAAAFDTFIKGKSNDR